jgi:hypothetical protein
MENELGKEPAFAQSTGVYTAGNPAGLTKKELFAIEIFSRGVGLTDSISLQEEFARRSVRAARFLIWALNEEG